MRTRNSFFSLHLNKSILTKAYIQGIFVSTIILLSSIVCFANSANPTSHIKSTSKTTATLTVDDDTGVDNGVSPFATITAAIAAASAGDVISVTGGADNTHTEENIEITMNLTITGQGQNTTIIQAHASQGSATDRVFRVLTLVTATFQDMTIRHGNASTGAGILIADDATVTLTNLNISKNDASSNGGGIACSGFSTSTQITITNCTISENNAATQGGGLYIDVPGTINISSSTFTSNVSSVDGGGASFTSKSATITITNSEFNSNTSTASGGGVYCLNTGTLSLTSSSFTSNNTSDDGGGLLVVNGTNTITKCAFVSNQVTAADGGGLSCRGGSHTITNSTFHNNNARNGAGVDDNDDSNTFTLMNCTIANNTATTNGGGLYIKGSSGSTSLINNLIADNSASSVNDVYVSSGSIGTNTTNLVENCNGSGSCPSFSVTSDPNLQAATTCNNLTYIPILASSSAAEAGSTGGSAPTVDQCGNARIGAMDIGAYEVTTSAGTITVNDEGGADHTTIADAILAATGGETIIVTGGSDNIHTEQGIQVNKQVTIKGQGQNTTIIQAHASQNSATDRVFQVFYTTVVFQDMTIRHGNVTGNGGAMDINEQAVVTLSNVTITKNNATAAGGGIHFPGTTNTGNLTIENSIISQNDAGGSSGGGLYSTNEGNIIITNTHFHQNTALHSGGAVYINTGNTTQGDYAFTNCSFEDNTAGTTGGGAFIGASTTNLTSCTFYDNTSTGNGGGLNDGTGDNIIRLFNCTIANNSVSSTNGGGIYFFLSSTGSNNMTNTIVANNTANGIDNDIYFSNETLATNQTNLVEVCTSPSTCPVFSITTDPNFQTAATCNDLTYLPILSSSPAANAGTNGGSVPTTDQCGNSRSAATDIGAYEAVYNPTSFTVDDDGAGDYLTITAAIAVATNGDTITITGGTDNTHTEEGVEINRNLVIMGQGQNTTIVQAHASQGSATDRVFDVVTLVTATFKNMTIRHGNVTGNGGGIAITEETDVTISNVTITDNDATIYGAGIYIEGTNTSTTLTISDCIISNNETPNSGATNPAGGGLFSSSDGTITITNTSFDNNSSRGGGGMVIRGTSNSNIYTIDNCSFSNNSANQDGGAIHVISGDLTIKNTTINGNTAGSDCGGLCDTNISGDLGNKVNLINCTVVDNTANGGSSKGGGVFLQGSGAKQMTNTIIANNTASDGNDLYLRNSISFTTNQTNLVESCASNNSCPSFSITTDPNLGTSTTCNGITYFPLSTSSPAINAGTSGGSVPTTDICGNARIAATDIGTSESSCPFSTAIFVNKAATGNNDGTSWTDAYTNLQDAIDNQCGGFDIWVAAGTYLPTDAPDGTVSSGVTDRNNAFHLATDMKIYGGFAGMETLLSQRNATTNVTILSGDFSSDDAVTGAGSALSITNNSENAYHILVTADLTSATVIDGFTIKGGNANGSSSITYKSKAFARSDGGGMYNRSSSPTITNSTFKHNRTNSDGAGIYNHSSSPTITNSKFASNHAYNGGGIYNNSSSSPTIANSTFVNNRSSASGGGIYNFSTSPTITNSTFVNNNGGDFGGGIYNKSSSSPTITNSIFWDNTKSGNNNVAGVDIEDDSGTPTVTYCLTQENSTYSSGTGIINNQDPRFVDAANDDYRLSSCSPALDVGDNTAWTSTGLSADIAGNTRPQNTTVDLGAYEGQVNTDSIALLELYNATTGASWTTTWNLANPINTWHGVTVNGSGCVTDLVLNNNNLAGTLPDLNLTSLTTLDLRNNQLTGGIPNFTNLTSLTQIFLIDNQLNGTIPDFSNLASLTQLYINGNQFTGTIPDFTNLNSLQHLNLSDNPLLSSTIPNFSNLPNLIFLYLNRSALTGTIPDFTNLPNLRQLTLRENQLVGSVPDFTNLPNLQQLYLDENQLTSLPDLSQLTALTQLVFDNNQFTFDDVNPNASLASGTNTYSPQDSFYVDTTMNVIFGNNLTIDLGIDEGLTTNSYQWYKNGVIDGATTTSHERTFTNFSAADVATYHVQVTNSLASDLTLKSRGITLTGSCFTISLSTTVTNANCNSASTGAIDLTVTNGTAPYSYNWDNGAGSNQDPTNLAANTYSVTVTDNNSCTQNTSATITEPTAIDLSTTPTHVLCNGASTGSIDLTASGGTVAGAYSYNWDNSAGSNQDPTNLAANTYSVTVTDDNGCTKNTSATITQPTAISLNAVPTDATGSGLSNGSIDLTVSGGTVASDYSYNWNNSAGTNQDPTGLAANTYSVTVTDDNGCTETTTTTVSEPSAISLSSTVVNVNCNGLSNGSIDLTVSGGVSPYSYSWDNSAGSNQDPTNLAANTYSVTVTDNNGITKSTSITISQPTAISLSTTPTHVLCNGASTGSIDLTASGGTVAGAYSYNWDNSAGSNQDPTNLAANTYSVTVTDDNGCTENTSVTITQPTAISLNTTPTHVLCNGASTGSIDLIPTGGTVASDYSYSWDNSAGSNQDPTSLAANTYSVTVTDDNGCTENTSVTITEPTAIALNTTPTHVLCNGASTGSIDLTASGGTVAGAYSYNWDNSAGSNQDPTNLAANTYSVTVTDDNGCTENTSVTITQPTAISLNTTPTHVLCNGASTGSIDLTASGGTVAGAYSYNWDNSAGSNQDPTNLAANTYSVTVTDDNGCTENTSATITEPTAITLSTTPTHVLCNGGNTGSIDLIPTGGTVASDYSYSWDNSAGSNQDPTSLAANTYSVTVTDDNGCTENTSVTITEPTAIALNTTPTHVLCNGASTGSIDLTVSGGTVAGPYSYNWNNSAGSNQDPTNLAANTYSVTVTDDNGCTENTSATITEPTNLIVSIAETQQITCINNGKALATVSGGAPLYSYQWDASANNQTTAQASNLIVGSYTVTVTDNNNCTAIQTIVLSDNINDRCRDSLALVNFYNATGGTNWTDKTNWLTVDSIDNWFGVTMGNSRVIRIDLPSNNLVGTIPDLELDTLRQLDLRNNNLTGGIPDFTHLDDLELLFLNNNTSIGGTLPSLVNCPNIRRIYTSNLGLTGSIPSSYLNLPILFILDVSNNNLNGTIPNFTQNTLVALYLSDNQFSGEIPNWNLPNITGINVSNNSLTGTLNLTQLGTTANSLSFNDNQLDSITSITADPLTGLNLSNNKFTFDDILNTNFSTSEPLDIYSPQDSLGSDTTIIIDIGTAYTYTIPYDQSLSNNYEWFKDGNAAGIATNEITFNYFTTADTGIYHYTIENVNAPDLTLYSRAINFKINYTCRHADSLVLVELYQATNGANSWTTKWDFNQPITTWHGITTTTLGCVTHIDLTNNNLEGEIPISMNNLKSLQSLKLSNNNIIALAFLTPLLSQNLTQVHVDNNQLTFKDITKNLSLSAIDFQYSPQKIVDEIRSDTVALGDYYYLEAQIDYTVSDNDYEWFQDGVSIGSTSDNQFLLADIDSDDEGVYTYEATNPSVLPLTLNSNPITLKIVNIGNDTSVCINSGILDLVETPLGGTWTGTGITNNQLGLFDPSIAGIGQHLITYTVGSSTDFRQITVYPQPSIEAGNDISVCASTGDFLLVGQSPTGGSWAGVGITNSNGIFNSNIAGVGAHTLTYTFTSPNTGCVNTDQITATVTTNTSVNILQGDTVRTCTDTTSIILTANVAGGIWNGPGVNPSTGEFIPSNTGQGSFNISYTIGIGSCQFSDFVTVIVEDVFVDILTTDLLICGANSAPIQLHAVPQGGTWSGMGVHPVTGVFSPTNLQGQGGFTTVIYSYYDNNTGCIGSDQITIELIQCNISAGLDQSVCNTGTVQLSGSPAGGTWSGSVVTPNGLFDANLVGLGNYKLYYSSGTLIDSMTLTVSPPPMVTAIDTVVCNNTLNFDLKAFPFGGIWDSGSTGLLSSEGTFNTVIGGGLDSSHFAIYTYTDNNNCTNSDTAYITFVDPYNDFPEVAEIFEESATYCIGADSITLPTGFPVGSFWTGPSFISNTEGTINPSVLGNGIYTYTYHYGNETCATTDDVTITINNDINIALGQDSFEICEAADFINFNDPAPAGGIWTGAGINGNGDNIFYLNEPTVLGTVGQYEAYYTYLAGSQCEVTDTVYIDVLGAPVITPNLVLAPSLAMDTLELCISTGTDTLDNFFNIVGPPSIVTWSPINSSISLEDINSGIIKNTQQGFGTFEIEVNANDVFCVVKDTFNVRITSIPQPNLFTTNVEICEDGYFDLRVNEPMDGSHYTFNRIGDVNVPGSLNDLLQDGTSNEFFITDISNDTFNIGDGQQFQAVKIDTKGCIASSNIVQITVNPLPIFDLEIDSTVANFNLCEGNTQTIKTLVSPNSPNFITDYAFYTTTGFLSGQPLQFGNLSSYSSNSLNDGDTIIVDVIDSDGCRAFRNIPINVDPLPNVFLTSSDTTICVGDNISFTGVVTNLTPTNYQFTVNNNSTLPTGSTVSSNTLNTNGLSFGDFVEIIATSAKGCIDSAMIQMIVDTLPLATVLFAPNTTNPDPLLDTMCQNVSNQPLLEAAISGSNITNTSWSSSTGFVYQNPAGQYQFDTDASNAGNQSVTIHLETLHGCNVSYTDSFYLKPKPPAAYTGVLLTPTSANPLNAQDTLIEVCSGSELDLLFDKSVLGNNVDIYWEIANGSPSSVGLNSNGEFLGDTATTMSLPTFIDSTFLMYTDFFQIYTKSDGCENKDDVLNLTLKVFPKPVIQTIDNIALCSGDTIQTIPLETQAPMFDFLSWQASDTLILNSLSGTQTIPNQITSALSDSLFATTTIQVWGYLYSPACATDTTEFDITLVNVPDVPTIYTPNGLDYCSNGSILIETVNFVDQYNWLRNSTDQVGTTYQINVSIPGDYTVSAINGACASSPSNPITVSPLSGISIGSNALGESVPPYFEKFENGKADWETYIEPLSSPSDWNVALPSGNTIDNNNNNSKAWVTNPSGTHSDEQQSWVISPCFDFTYSNQPIIAFRYISDMKNNVTGAVLQYDLGTGNGWQTLGQDTLATLGESWYNGNNIFANPGEQSSGWTNTANSWNIARYPLDELVGQDAVRFRFAFAADGQNSELKEGFAFDDVWIGERYKPILIETFTHSEDTATNELVYDALNSDTSLIGIQYHLIDATDPFHQFNIPDNNARGLFYNILPLVSTPQTIIDGNLYNDNTIGFNDLGWSPSDYNVHQLEPSPFRISPIIQKYQGSNNIAFTSSITLKDTSDILLDNWNSIQNAIDNEKIVVRGVVIEDSVFIANTNTHARNVMRKMTPNQGGLIFRNSQNDYWFSWTDNLVTTSTTLDVVIFVQNVDTKEVYMVRSGSTQFVPTRNVPTPGNNNLTVFPNPSNQYFEVKFDAPIEEEATWEIYSIDGKIMDNGYLPKNLEGFRYQSGHLPSGIYFISIKTPSYQLKPKKIVIVR